MVDTGDDRERADEPGWEVGPEDDSGTVIAVGRQIKLWREGAGMRATELGKAVGYGEGLVYKVEAGKRIPRPEFLTKVDEVLGARGKITAMAEDLEKARYPKKLRDLAKLEAQAVQLEAYGNHNLHGLLQTREYAQALFETRQPALTQDEVERQVSARTARKSIFDRSPAPALSFVQEETTLRRPIGGRMVLRRQLEHLLALARLRNVSIQVMPTSREENAGMVGLIQVLRFRDGTALGRCDGEFNGRPVSDPKDLQILELSYGMIRAQALTPNESRAFIEEVLGET
ncbi:helix-turn-helix domain-containing protein [Streptomyces sp. NPDC054866]